MSSRSFSSSIFSTIKRTRSCQPFSPQSTLLCTASCSTHRAKNSHPEIQPSLVHPPQKQSFTTTPLHLKKQGGKGSSKNTVAVNASKTANDNADPTDFSALETEISKIIENLREGFRYIKAGGVNVGAVEDARVVLKAGGGVDGGGKKGAPKEVVRLRDVCQAVPRGRTLVLMVGEKEHIKPITSALSAPPLSLAPMTPSTPSASSSQQSPEIHIPIPPTTGESRNAALKTVSTKGESALFALREARGAQKKRLRQLELGCKIGPDMARKAVRKLDQVNEDGVERIKKAVEEKKKALVEG
ncbi:MAG: hypothetical protein Q9221_006379 [Calogaya cf. arnoldii]